MSRPLVVLTTAQGSFAGLAALLDDKGFDVLASPLLTFREPADWSPVDQLIRCWLDTPVVALTSPRAAQALVDRAAHLGMTLGHGPAVWAGGPATGAVLSSHIPGVMVPTGDGRAGLTVARAILEAGVPDSVVFACGDRHLDDLPTTLQASGVPVEEVVCYRSDLASNETARRAIAGAQVIVAGSPRLAGLLAEVRQPGSDASLVAVGPSTAEAARRAGWPAAAVAAEPSSSRVAEAVASVFHE